MEKSNKKIKNKKIIITAFILLSCILVVSLITYLGIDNLFNKINYSAGLSENVYSEIEDASQNSTSEDIEAIASAIEDNIKNESTPIIYDKDVLNILLIGKDSFEYSGRSDSMILLSINKRTKKIIATSIMRDIYVSIPNNEDNRINAAYAFGGPALLLDTIKENFKINIEKYISVDFMSFVDIIDELGGVNIDVKDYEISNINGGVRGINQLKGLPIDDGMITNNGNTLLFGKQALSYSRIRHVGNGDFERTERQRNVLYKVFLKLKDQNIVDLYNVLNKLLPNVTTNLTKGELFDLLLSAQAYSKFDVIQNRVPIEGTYKNMAIKNRAVLGIDFEKNIIDLQSKIYD